MKKSELLKRIEELELRVKLLEARPYSPPPILYSPIRPTIVPNYAPHTAPNYPFDPYQITCSVGGVAVSDTASLQN